METTELSALGRHVCTMEGPVIEVLVYILELYLHAYV